MEKGFREGKPLFADKTGEGRIFLEFSGFVVSFL